ncbi:MAG: hypothetical protein ABL989_13410 [Gammaproteobacteria bacterium]
MRVGTVRKRATLALAAALSCLATAVADVRPEDFPGCNATRGDDTECWQQALDAAIRVEGYPYFGAVAATAGKTYYIRDTLTVTNAHGGVIDGHGAVLEWAGSRRSVPMFLLTNTQSLRVTNLYIRAGPDAPLQAAFEFTKGLPVRVNPRYNILDHVIIDGTSLNGLQYGVRFTARNGIDEDNDQATIINSGIYNVTTAGISIEHSQSHDHRLLAVNSTGATGNTAAAFVNVKDGSFTSIGGFHGRFALANYYVAGSRTGTAIINENSEGSAALLRTPEGSASFLLPVQVIGGRFAIDDLQPSGRVVDFHRYGPLTIQGLNITGTIRRPGAARPTIYFWPTAASGQGGYAELAVTGVGFAGIVAGTGSNAYDPIVTSPIARVTAGSNSCITASGVATQCAGRAGGASPWVRFADLAELSIPGQSFYCADCGRNETTDLCRPGGNGQFARRLPRGWLCD